MRTPAGRPELAMYLSGHVLETVIPPFPELAEEEDIEQVRFCSTAYNASFYGTYERIRSKTPAASTILISYRLPERSVTLIPR